MRTPPAGVNGAVVVFMDSGRRSAFLLAIMCHAYGTSLRHCAATLNSLTYSLRLTHSLTHPPTHPLTHPPTDPPTHPLTHSLTHSCTHVAVHKGAAISPETKTPQRQGRALSGPEGSPIPKTQQAQNQPPKPSTAGIDARSRAGVSGTRGSHQHVQQPK